MFRILKTMNFPGNRILKLFLLTVVLFMTSVFNVQCGKNTTIYNDQQQAKQGFHIFDKIITRNFFNSSAKNDALLKFVISNFSETEKIYSVELLFKKKDPYEHYICSIGVAKAGTYIKDKEYEASYAYYMETLQKEHPDNWQEFLKIEFPDIGKRAIRDRGTFGPGGAMFAVMFTSSDGKFDIKASISSNLPDNVDDPEFDISEMLTEVSDRYDHYRKVGN